MSHLKYPEADHVDCELDPSERNPDDYHQDLSRYCAESYQRSDFEEANIEVRENVFVAEQMNPKTRSAI